MVSTNHSRFRVLLTRGASFSLNGFSDSLATWPEQRCQNPPDQASRGIQGFGISWGACSGHEMLVYLSVHIIRFTRYACWCIGHLEPGLGP